MVKKSDLFRRSLEVGTSFVDLTRERADAVVKEWVDAGDLGRGKAKKAVDELLDRSQRVTEELRAMIRREIGEQLKALGVATSDDLARIEARIDEVAVAARRPPATRPRKAAPEPAAAPTEPEPTDDGPPTAAEGGAGPAPGAGT